jgi:hypothetical protein
VHEHGAEGIDRGQWELETRECFRAGIGFCRRHKRMDAWCLLLLEQHWAAARMHLAFDSRLGL